jgi:hypothetical protein
VKAFVFIFWVFALIACSSPPVTAPAPPEQRFTTQPVISIDPVQIWELPTVEPRAYQHKGSVLCWVKVLNGAGQTLHAIRGVMTWQRKNAPVITLEFEEVGIDFRPEYVRGVAYTKAYTDRPPILGCSVRVTGTTKLRF